MKKHRFLAMFLSIFLLASPMLVACSGDDNKNNNNNGENPEVSIDYKTRVEAWEEYIEYDAEAFKTAKPVQVKEISKVTDGNSSTSYYDGIYLQTTTTNKITKINEVSINENTEKLYKQEDTISYTIYNSETEEKIATYIGKQVFVDEVEGEEPNQTVVTKEDLSVHTTYQLSSITNGIFYVTKNTYKAEKEEGSEITTYKSVVEYRYFDINNNELSKWEEKLDHNVYSGANENQKYATVLDKTYVLNDGEIVATFEKGFELSIPYYNGAIEIGDYAYVVNEKPLQAIGGSGDLTLVACPGSSIKVIDKNYNIVVDYETTADVVLGFGIMSDGNVMLSQYSFVDTKATEFDAEANGIKYDIKNVIIDVKTGVATEVANTNYIISSVYTNATELLASGNMYNPNLSDGTMSLIAGGAKIKDGYFLANVQKVNEKTLSNERVIAVLNNKLEIVKELPNVIENQFGYAGFSSEEGLSVKTLTAGDKLIDYYVSTNNYEVNMYMKADYKIKGGFIANKKVYNNNYVELLDLQRYEGDYTIVEDVLLIKDYREDDYKDDEYEYTVAVYVSGSSLHITEIDADYVGYDSDIEDEEINDSVITAGSLIIYRNHESQYGMRIYDRYGKSLFSGSKSKLVGGKYVSTRFEISGDGSTITKIEETRNSNDVTEDVTSKTITRYSVK